MTVHREELFVETPGRGTVDITREVQRAVANTSGDGLATVFVHHTSASLFINENADPDVRRDLETFMARLAPDGDPMFVHTAEGPDDMPAHVRSVLTSAGLHLPVTGARCALGTWQGVYLWEHRRHGHRRTVIVTVQGE